MVGTPLVKEVVSFAAFVVGMGIFWRYIQRSFSNLQGESERATQERERMVEAFCDYLKENGTKTSVLLDRLAEGQSRLIEGHRSIAEQMQKTTGALNALVGTIESHEAYIRGYLADRPRSPTS
jgi:hypothetical protein